MFERQQKQIIDSLKGQNSAQSWLVIGPKGVGKVSFAKELVCVLTESTQEYNQSAQWISRGLTEAAKKEIQKALLAGESLEEKNWTKKTQIAVEDIREGCRFLSLKSNKIKILVINLADEMNENAQNALLKTLEEPYPNTLILLLCERPGRLLPTILSRCQKLYLTPPSFEVFQKQIKALHPELEMSAVTELAFLSDNLVSKANNILALDGLTLYHQTIQFLKSSHQKAAELLTFLDSICKETESFELLKLCLLKYLSHQTKQEAPACLEKAYLKSVKYMEFKQLLERIDFLNLDKKQSLISIFNQIAEVL